MTEAAALLHQRVHAQLMLCSMRAGPIHEPDPLDVMVITLARGMHLQSPGEGALPVADMLGLGIGVGQLGEYLAKHRQGFVYGPALLANFAVSCCSSLAQLLTACSTCKLESQLGCTKCMSCT